jgi:hypothetical protein
MGGVGAGFWAKAKRAEPERSAKERNKIEPDRNMWKRIPQTQAKAGSAMGSGEERELNREKNVMHLTFKCAYNAVESNHNSCTMPNLDTCN